MVWWDDPVWAWLPGAEVPMAQGSRPACLSAGSGLEVVAWH